MIESAHRYGPDVQLVGDAAALSLLGRLCAKGTAQPDVSALVAALYRHLLHLAAARELPRRRVEIQTRMIDHTPAGVWSGEIVDSEARAVVVCIARAGILPSQVCFDALNWMLRPANVRQDHLTLARTVGASGEVTGAAVHGAKIGGAIDGAFVLLPDPMGATGSTLATALEHYRHAGCGTPARVIALNLIVTPEYLRRVASLGQPVTVYALRVDRGLSPPDVLRATPGERWAEERGLDAHGYIVPGAGGLGEVMSNCDA